MAEQVLKGQLDFHREPWPTIASPVKELVRSMLHLDPTKRLTAPQVLGNPFPPDLPVGWLGGLGGADGQGRVQSTSGSRTLTGLRTHHSAQRCWRAFATSRP